MIKSFIWLKFLRNRLITVRLGLRLLLVFSVAWVGAYQFYLVNIPEWFPKASVLGSIVDKICFAYITAFIFYFVNVHIPSYKHKVKTFRYVNNKSASIKHFSTRLMSTIKDVAGVDNADYKIPNKEDFVELCKKVNPNSNVVTIGFPQIQFSNWYEFFDFLDSETKKLVKDLLFIRESLDSETVRILTFIEDNLGMHVNLTKGKAVANKDLEVWAESIYDYIILCDELIEHLKKEYRTYQLEYHYLEAQNNIEKRKIEET